jgi:phosphoribosylformylglycinamidine synthase subunit PurS
MTWLARVHVLLKPVVNDPQGQAIQGGLKSLGFDAVQRVRAGKYFEIQVEAPDAAEAQRQAEDMCRKLLANPVIEDYRVAVEEQQDVTADTV